MGVLVNLTTMVNIMPRGITNILSGSFGIARDEPMGRELSG
jgi:hypothetical protein